MSSVLFVSAEPVGARMSGPGIRALELARVVAEHCAVTVAAPSTAGLDEPGIEQIEAGPSDYETLLAAARAHDVVVGGDLPPQLLWSLAGLDTRFVADLYNPIVVETIERDRGRSSGSRRRRLRVVTEQTIANLAAADFVLCASERQRDLWLGTLAGAGLVDPETDRADPSLRGLIDVVASGVPERPPAPGPAHLRALDAVGADDAILVWGGGIWPWLDALTPIRALERLADREPAIHLHFPAIDRPSALDDAEMAGAREAIAYAEARGLLGRRVHVGGAWLPYERRAEYLLEADLGVSAHRDHLEARYAFRTRILDYLWAGLPSIVTRGDVLAERIERGAAGAAVDPGDDEGLAASCLALLDDPRRLAAAQAAASALAAEYRWRATARPLVEYCLDYAERPRPRRSRRAVGRAVAALYPRLLVTELERNGIGGLGRKLSRNVVRTVRRRR